MPSRSYVMYGAVAAGGMASVHLGKLLAPGGFTRRVAIKRLHPQLASDPEIASAFADEARHAARVSHVNVAAMLDVVSADGELLLVMEYVHGESLSRLLITSRAAKQTVPLPIVVTVLADVLHGLQAAHEATGEDGTPLGLIHRDVSPQNVLVGTDGVARVVDFGIAKAITRAHVTRDGRIKGKMPYMAPEQLLQRAIDRRVDVYAAGVLLWEALAGQRLFRSDDEATLFHEIVEAPVLPPSRVNPEVPATLDAITMRALDRSPDRRYGSAREMAVALEATTARAPASAVAEWVTTNAMEALAKRNAMIAESERDARAVDSSGAAVRVPSASVVFREATAPQSVRFVANSVPNVDLASGGLESGKRPASRVLAIALVAILLVALGAFALFFRGDAKVPGGAAASPPGDTPVEPAGPALDPSPPPAAPATGSVAVVSAPPPQPVAVPAPAPARAAAPSMRWCKVFDTEKRIFVMKPMRVARCP